MAGIRYEPMCRDDLQKIRDAIGALTRQCDALLKRWDAAKIDQIVGPKNGTEASVDQISGWTDLVLRKIKERAKVLAKQARSA
jgi:hypothetical protein